ncbi:hypothetical protein Y1Q_0008870 [Alligator mississippiensis]|uniref:Uncharacterized protein n=1 Tax=Alligator mississippiensis TaxID=8496 RepID=A0A151NB81_ALLMI|nr:hypothetical protein Y1Q_0008870 [Alligator mississippiensis]
MHVWVHTHAYGQEYRPRQWWRVAVFHVKKQHQKYVCPKMRPSKDMVDKTSKSYDQHVAQRCWAKGSSFLHVRIYQAKKQK